MLDRVREMIISALTSKKAIATIAAIVVAAAGRLGLGIPEATVTQIIGMIAAYIVGQGVADIGKPVGLVAGDRFREMIISALTSKKALATIAGIIVATAGRYGLGIPEETVVQILSVIAAYVVGQGVADIGKQTGVIT